MRRFLTGLAAGLLMALPAAADIVLIAPSDPLIPGSTIQVEVMFTNPEARLETVDVPSRIVGYRVAGGGSSVKGALQLSDPAQVGAVGLKPGTFAKHVYELQVPEQWRGVGRLVLNLSNAPTALVEIAAPPVQVASASDANTRQIILEPGTEEGTVIESIESAVDEVYELSEDAPFGVHEPMYFVYGMNPDEIKFQISFKYRLFHNIKDTSPLRWLQNLNVGYTQLSFWDFDSASKPFKDSSYKPELFYDIGDPSNPDDLIFPGLGLRHVRLGFLHESNGQDGLASRSLNCAYIQPEFIYDFDRPTEDCRECE
jgi:phospholipase A1/A2